MVREPQAVADKASAEIPAQQTLGALAILPLTPELAVTPKPALVIRLAAMVAPAANRQQSADPAA